MTKISFPIRRSVSVRFCERHWLFIALSIVGGCTLLAATNGAEQSDSGWAIAAPSPLATGTNRIDPDQQMLLRQVLQQSQQPLLKKPVSTPVRQTPAAQTTTDAASAGVRVAERSDGMAGWRAVGQATSQLGGGAIAHTASTAALPSLGSPKGAAARAPVIETDCSGGAAPVHASNTKHSAAALADAYGDAPSARESGIEEETFQGNARDELGLNAAEAALEHSSSDEAPSAGDEEVESSDEIGPAGASTDSKLNDTQRSNPIVTRVAPAEDVPPPPLTKQLMALRTRVRSVLSGYYRKSLNSRDNDPWETMHGMLAYGVHSRIHQGGPRGDQITSVGWLCYNKPCKGQTLMYVNPQGEVRAKYGVGLQGHLGQLLAMLAQCHVSPDYPIHVGNKEFTVRDLIEAEKKTCYPKSELTFKLIALQYYGDLDDKWVNDQGVEWDMPRLVREELAQPIRGAACGGTHRLSGLSLAVKTRIRRGEPLDGEYARAAEFVKKYQQYAFRLQNRDGSLSTSWFRGAGDDDDINRRIKTSGHILEWLCYSLSDEELRDQRTVRAVTYLANLMYSNYDNEWEVGPVSHATHALLLYDERVFRPFDKEGAVTSYRPVPQMANNGQGSSKR